MIKQFGWRSKVVAFILAALGLSIIIQMVRIQNSPEAEIFRQKAKDFAVASRTIYPARGEIFDRNGHQLAGNRTVYEIGVNLEEVRIYDDTQTIAEELSKTLGLDYNEVVESITHPPLENLKYLGLADYIPASQANILMEKQNEYAEQANKGKGNSASLAGLEFTAHYQRTYPENELASNIIGFVTQKEGVGFFGIEGEYDEQLAGTKVEVLVPQDPNRAEEIPKVPDGTTLILTIHRELQAAVEDILDEALSKYGAQSGTIIVMDPRSGEIYTIAATPRLNLNKFWNYYGVYNNGNEFNRAISIPYEPGSVFKILTMAAALDSGTVQPDTIFLDTGAITVGGHTIRNWNGQAWGYQDMTGCLQHSLNVCLAWVSSQMGAETFYQYMQRFGIGHLTGIDLAGETSGRIKFPGDDDWYPVELGTNAFGQGVDVTTIQMIMAGSAIANDGRMVTPHVVKGMIKNGVQYNTPLQIAGTPITASTAHTLNEMLANSLEEESSSALVSGFRVAGKTGTAEILVPNEGYTSGGTNASFIGWGPVDDPRFIVYIWLEKPTASIWGSETAAPVFAQVVEKIVVLMNIPPDEIRFQVAAR